MMLKYELKKWSDKWGNVQESITEAHKTGKESIYLNTLKYQNKILSIYNSRTGTLYHYLQITDTNNEVKYV